jgi:aminomethyltransferase
MGQTTSIDEYRAVRDHGAGLIDLSARGRILVSGSEAEMFLNGLITNDVNALELNSWMPAAFANVQGRLLAAVRVIHRQDGILLDTEPATRETVIQLLERFTLAGDFKLADFTESTALLSVQGPKAADVVRAIFKDEAAAIDGQSVVSVKLDDHSLTSIRATHTGEDGFDFFVERHSTQALRDALVSAGATPVGADTVETLRVEAGISRYGVDMNETNVVTETNLEDAISFTKGCYVGQEIIIRIKHRGHVAKKMTGVILEGNTTAPRDSKIISEGEKEIGRVTSSTFSPRLERAIALAYVKYDYLAPGTRVKVVGPDYEIAGAVTDLPFLRGSWYERKYGSQNG